MLRYTLDCRSADLHLLTITLHLTRADTPAADLQLPAWRPGRYELANYAKNMLPVQARTPAGHPLHVEKVARNRWRLHLEGHTEADITWRYYAGQLDAGGSWLDEALVYINFINCLLYVEGRQHEPCEVALLLPHAFVVACGLPSPAPRLFRATDFLHLADCPLLASATLQHHTYDVDGVPFHVWVQGGGLVPDGEDAFDWDGLLLDFQRFTKVQIATMGAFPEPDYHFLLILVPHAQYHGVEHRNSTVMVLGPADQLAGGLYAELAGLASHELFHAWNVCKLRPKELLPYDLSRETYFPTGYVAEGLTTYYGDLFLVRSGFFSEQRYLAELTQTLNRHFSLGNAAALSLMESSVDLWVDGYTAGVPNRKVSIYHKGALAALILDMEIRQLTDNARSLDDVLRLLWQRFGASGIGYAHADYMQAAEDVAGRPLADYFAECVAGTAPLAGRLQRALAHAGCLLDTEPVAERPGCLVVRITAPDPDPNRQLWLGQPAKHKVDFS